MPVLQVPYWQQEKMASCVYASTRMVLDYNGVKKTEDQLRDLYWVDHDRNGTSELDLARLLHAVNKEEGTNFQATYFVDPTDDHPHAVVYNGRMDGMKLVSNDSPRKFVNERFSAGRILPTLKRKALEFYRKSTDDFPGTGSGLGPVYFERKGPFVSEITGSPRAAFARYLGALGELEEILQLGHDVRMYVLAIAHGGQLTLGSVRQETVQGFVESGHPVMGAANQHCMVVVGFEDGKPVVHDPEVGPQMVFGTKIHKSRGLSEAVLIQQVH